MENIYNSEYAEVYYVLKENVVFVKWKKYCEIDEYRKPLLKALDVIKDHKCDYVADTRNGFIDNLLDTIWVKDYFMVKAKEYGCNTIFFIIDKNNSLKEELEGQEKDSNSILEFKYIYSIDELKDK